MVVVGTSAIVLPGGRSLPDLALAARHCRDRSQSSPAVVRQRDDQHRGRPAKRCRGLLERLPATL